MKPTSAADLPEARWFLDRLRGAPCSGLVLLHKVGNHERATHYLRALEDEGLIRPLEGAIGPRSAWQGNLVGQQNEAVRFRGCPRCSMHVGTCTDGSLRRHECVGMEAA